MAFDSKPGDSPAIMMNELVRRLNENSRRIKYVEQKAEKVESTVTTLEETALMRMNDLKINLERIEQKMTSLAERLNVIESEILHANKEIGKSVTKAEIKHLEAYIDLMNPITSKFITREELERVLEENAPKKVLRA